MRSNPRHITIVLLAAAALAGCSTTNVYLDGVGPDGRLAPDVRYVLESQAGNEGSVTVAGQGVQNGYLDGRTTDTLRFRLVIDNASSDPVEIPIDGVALTDDQNHNLRRVESSLPREPGGPPPGLTCTVVPGERTSIEVLFDVGAPGALATTGSVTLEWAYRFRGQEVRHRTRFLPTRYYRSTVVYSAGVYYGPGWYGPCW